MTAEQNEALPSAAAYEHVAEGCPDDASRVVETCRLCHQTRIFTGDFAVEYAQMFLEDGGHYCVDIVRTKAHRGTV